jgi:hypothetical protein
VNDATRIRWSLTGPAEVLAAVPYLLGFHPTDGDTVCLALRDRRVLGVARTDLPAPGTDPVAIRTHLTHMTTHFTQAKATDLILVGYGPAERVTPVMDAAVMVAAEAGLGLFELLRLTGGRYHSYLCDNPACCPPEGRVFDPSSSVVAPQATLGGHAPLPDRQRYLAQIAPVTGPARQAMRQASERARARLERELGPVGVAQVDSVVSRLGAAALDSALAGPDRWPLPVEEAAWLILLLTHPSVRDQAWERTQGHSEHLDLWMDLTRRAEPCLLGNTAGICALSAFEEGKDLLGRAVLDRIVHEDPTHPLATVVTAPVGEPDGHADRC